MLIQFSVGNYLSFKDIVTFSMVASTGKELEKENVSQLNEKFRLLKSAAIYGANASGKSNLIKAMKFMRRFVKNSAKTMQSGEQIDVENFKLSTETEDKPCLFEIIFIHEEVRYRYGFEIDTKAVFKEWLFYAPKGKETKLFERKNKNIELGTHYKEGRGLIEKTRENALFLSVVAQFNGEISIGILDWFGRFRVHSGLKDRQFTRFAQLKLEDPDFKKKIIDLIKIADLGIEDMSLTEKVVNSYEFTNKWSNELRTRIDEQELTRKTVSTVHKKFDKNNTYVSLEKFDLVENESDGTKKFFALSAPVLVALERGYTLVIDEMASTLHPKLSSFLIKLFNSSKTNKSNAQLIFASHDVSPLNKYIFRRDQIWFIEKNQFGSSDLFSLFEYKVRKDASFDKDYILGKYGAVPFIGNPESLFIENNDDN